MNEPGKRNSMAWMGWLSAGLFAVYAIHAVVGAFAASPALQLGEVLEMWILLAAVVAFEVVMLRAEAHRLATGPSAAGDADTGTQMEMQ